MADDDPTGGAFFGYHPMWGWGDRAVLVAGSDIVFVVTWIRLTNGAFAFALDPNAGRYLWARSVHGLGEVIHSRYSNDVGAAVIDDQLVIVGVEGGGRYVEILDRAGNHVTTIVRPL